MKRVVVTGMGAVTPIGITVEKFWESVLEGKVGIGPIQNFDTTQYKAKLSAEVIDFDPKAYIEPKAAKRMDRFSQMAVTASIEAMQDSGLNIEEEDSYRLGVCVGSGVGSLMGIEREYDKMLAKGREGYIRLQPHWSWEIWQQPVSLCIMAFRENALM